MKGLALLLVLSLAGVVCSVPTEQEFDSELNQAWQEFKSVHRKQYDDAGMELVRRLIWESNVRYIQKHNIEHDLGMHTYTLGVNQFTDLTFDEFRSAYLGLKPQNLRGGMPETLYMSPLNIADLPDTVDWRTKGYVTEVKNQGSCGSCWAFSTTGSMEGQYFRKSGQLVSLSEQQLVDCSHFYGNFGCHGGLMNRAFDYIKRYGIERESDYNYTAHDDKCKYDASKIVTKCTGYVIIPKGHEDTLKNAVATAGPVSVAIDAGHPSFQHYQEGVYSEPACSSTRLDHGVLAVGYGNDGGLDYWLVKNSWAASWGDAGYIKMSRNKQNQCGIATDASYPLL